MHDTFFDLYGVYKLFVTNSTYLTPVVGWMSAGVEESTLIGALLPDLDQFRGDPTQTRG